MFDHFLPAQTLWMCLGEIWFSVLSVIQVASIKVQHLSFGPVMVVRKALACQRFGLAHNYNRRHLSFTGPGGLEATLASSCTYFGVSTSL
jgi:hypothetical protein